VACGSDHGHSSRSGTFTEVKQRRPRLILGRVTAREDRALWTCYRSSVWTLICDRPSIYSSYRADTDLSQSFKDPAEYRRRLDCVSNDVTRSSPFREMIGTECRLRALTACSEWPSGYWEHAEQIIIVFLRNDNILIAWVMKRIVCLQWLWKVMMAKINSVTLSHRCYLKYINMSMGLYSYWWVERTTENNIIAITEILAGTILRLRLELTLKLVTNWNIWIIEIDTAKLRHLHLATHKCTGNIPYHNQIRSTLRYNKTAYFNFIEHQPSASWDHWLSAY